MNETLTVKRESLPVRCEVCHQTDLFNPETGICERCSVTLIPENDAPVPVEGVPGRLAVHRWNVPVEFENAFLQAVGDEPVLWVGRQEVQPEGGFEKRMLIGSAVLAIFVVVVAVAVYCLLFDAPLSWHWGIAFLSLLFISVLMMLGVDSAFVQENVLYALTPTRCLKIGSRPASIERIPLSSERLGCVMVDSSRDFGHLVMYQHSEMSMMGLHSLRTVRHGFFYIENVHLVERLVREHLLKGVERVGNADH
jgi:hypothetical protein